MQFGGVNASGYTVVSANQITATVPFTAVSGSVSVTAPGGTGTLAGFSFIPLAVTGFTPTTAGPAMVVTITGTSFTGATQVQFGGVNAASFTVVSATQITATPATGGASGSVSVISPAGTSNLAGFTFMPNLFYYTGGDAAVRTNWNSVLGGGGVNPLIAQFMANSGDTYIFPTSIPAATLATPLTVGNGVTVTVQNPVTFTASAALTVNAGATLSIDAGGVLVANNNALTNNGTINVLGSLTFFNNATFTGVSPIYSGALATLLYSGAGNRTTGTEFPATLNATFVVDKVGQTVTLNGNRTVLNTFYPFNGTVAMGNFTLTASGNLDFSGAGTLSGGATAGLVIDGAGTITGNLNVIAPASFGAGLTLNRAGVTLTLAGAALTATPLAVSAGTLNTGALNQAFVAPISIGGSAVLSVDAGFTTTFGGNSVNNSTLTLNGTLNMGTTTMSGTGSLAINATGTLVTAHPTGLSGALTNSGGIAHNGTVRIQGASVGNSLGLNLNNLVIDRATAVTLPQNISVNGVLTIANVGNLDLAGRQLTFGAAATTTTTATGTIDASGAASSVLLMGTSLNGAHFTGGAIRTLSLGGGVPTLSNSLAITGLFDMTNNITLGAPHGRLWLRNGATLNAPGTRIQGTDPTSEVMIDPGFGGSTFSGSTFAVPYNGAITFLGPSNLTGTLTQSAGAGAFAMGGNITLQAASSLTLNQTAANSLRGTGVLQGSGATSGILLGSGFNANVLPADRFAPTLNANLTTPGGASVLTNGALTLGAAQTLTLGGRLTTTLANILRVTNTATTSIAGASTTNYIDGPLERSLLGGIVANGTTYLLPIGDGTSYRPMTLRDVRTGAAPLMRARVVGAGATLPDNLTILSLLSGRNWQLETVSGVFTSSTLDLTEGGLMPTDLIGMSAAQAGAYASIGGIPNVGFVRSTAQAALGNRFYAIAGTPPSTFYYNETLLGDASLASSWNSVANGSGVPATPALMTSGMGVAFIVRSGITATATGSMSFGAGVSLTLQPASRLTLQSGALSIAGTAGISGILNIGTGASLSNSGTVNIAGDGILRLTGNASVSGTAPVFVATTSVLEYDGTAATTAGLEWMPTAAHVIRIGNTGNVRLSSNRTFANTANLTVQANGVLRLNDGIALTNNGNLLVSAQATVRLDGNSQINGSSGVTYLSTSTLEFTDATATPNASAGGKAFPATMYGNVIAKNSFTLLESKTVHGAWTGTALPATATATIGGETLTLLGAIDFGGTALQSTASGGFVVEGAGAVIGSATFPSGNLGTLAVKRPGVKLRLGSVLTLAAALRLEGGIIVSTGAGITLLPASNGALVGGSEASYVEGALGRALAANLSNDAASWLFPIGKGDVYLPLALAQLTTGAVAPLFRANVFRDIPPSSMILASGETGTLNNGEVWNTRVESGNYTSAAFTLTRSNASTNLPSGTRVASSPATTYTSRGGTVSGKSVTSSVTNALGYFAVKFPSSLVISDFSPKSGTTGTVVTIRGLNLHRATTLFFGSQPTLGTSSFSVISPNELRVTVRNDFASGKIQLWTDPLHGILGFGERVYSDSTFNFIAPPTVTLFSPTSGVAGTSVTLYGSNLGDVTNVYFNGVPATSFRLISGGEVEAVAPPNGFGRITLVNAAGSTITPSAFGNLTPPAITGFTPSAGISGSFVTINGSNFLGATAVKFGTINASSFSILSNTRITAVVGPGGATGQVSVTGPGGTGLSFGTFTFGLTPTIAAITPSPAVPRTIVTATGTNLDGIQAVSVGGLAADSLQQISPTQVRFRVPALTLPAGRDTANFTVQVKVSSGTAISTLTVISAPTLGTILPDSGRVSDTVRIRGTGLTNLSSVTFAGIPAVYHSVSPTELWAIVPSGVPYSTQLIGVTARGVNLAPARWLHIPPRPTLAEQSLDSGEIGTTLRLAGTNFFSDSRIFFNGLEAASIIINSTTSITAVVPRGARTGFVTLTTQYGTAAMPRSFTVLQPQPRITAFSPNRGGAGTVVRVTGVRFDSTARVLFGGVPAQTLVGSTTDAVAIVPTGVALGEVSLGITTQLGATQALERFTVLPAPILTNIEPISEGAGERISVSGRNFTGVTTLTVGGVRAVNLTVESDTLLSFTADGLPVGSGTVTALSPGGQGSYGAAFEVLPPSVANAPRNLVFTPTVGATGERIRVTGRNLGNIVAARIGGASAGIEQISTTEIVVIVGRGASGALVLTNGFGTGGSRTAFRYQTQLELDSLALVAFYEAHRAANAVLPRSWMTAARLSAWEGVTVRSVASDGFAEERITGLNLEGRALNGRTTGGRLQTSVLARLAHLQLLNLSNNQLLGTLSGALAPFRALRELRLTGNALTGELLSAFGVEGFPATLEILDLRRNRLTGSVAADLFALPNLRELLLSENAFAGGLVLNTASRLVSEAFPGKSASVQGVAPLERIEISNNQLSGVLPSALGDFAVLHTLHLDGNRFTGAIPARLGEAKNLQRLVLGANALTGAVPQELRGLGRLQYLSVEHNRLTAIPDFGGQRRSLKMLAVAHNRLDFGSLESNMALDTVRYIPQDTIGVAGQAVTGIVGLPLRITLAVGGTANQTTWEIGGARIGGLPTAFRMADTGRYVGNITNARVPGLTLVTRPVQVSGRLPNPPATAPMLVLPQNNAAGIPSDARLEWTQVTESERYEVEVSLAADISSPIAVVQSSSTASVAAGLANLTRYFWRVRAVNAGGTGPWSAVRSFVTVRSGAIVTAVAEAFGKTAIGDVSFARLMLKNLTTQVIRVDSLRFGESENSFETRTAFRALTLAAREERTVVIAFSPKSVGVKEGSLEAVFTVIAAQTQEREAFSALLFGRGTALKTLAVDFDTVIAGKPTISPALLINRGRAPLTVSAVRYVGSTNGLVSDVFSFQGAGSRSLTELPIQRGLPLMLESGDTLRVVTRCEPTSVGEKRAELQWQTSGAGADTAETDVLAFVKPPEPADVVVKFGIRAVDAQGKPIAKATPGSTVLLELYIAEGNLDSLVRVAQPEFTASLRYDRNVLSVTAEEGFARVVRNGAQERYQRLQLAGGRWSGRGQRLALVRCRAVAGDTTATALEIESSAWGGLASTGQRAFWERRVFMLAPENGAFGTEVSRAGGLRLIAPAKPALAIAGVAPNPAKETLEVSYSLAESGLVEISLINARGETVQIMKSEMQFAGDHAVQARVERLPIGSYTVQVRAGGEVVTRGVQVVR